jgi:integrase/recombinase XerD
MRLTHLARAGFELLEIARYAGHRQLETSTVYIHLSGRELGEKVADACAGPSRSPDP